jgi:phosphopantothenoylcysteine decarboxylase/phosphopantothenate--cysteine ligase
MPKSLRGKKILVTAGPTWVPIDAVRVISNVSSGLTGIAIASHAAKMGGTVTLLLGPVGKVTRSPGHQVTSLKIKKFKYFDELQKLVKNELKCKKYDILIHVAAVSDYRPAAISLKKISSGKERLVVALRPTVKIVGQMRKRAKGAFLVIFKLEALQPRRKLIEIAYNSLRRTGADMVVANNIGEVGETRHKAYIIDPDKNVVSVNTKEELAKRLLVLIAKKAS